MEAKGAGVSRDNREAASQSGVAAGSSNVMMLVIFIVVALLCPVTPAGSKDHKEVDNHLGLHLPVFVSQGEKGETIDHDQESIYFNTANTNRNTGMYFLVNP